MPREVNRRETGRKIAHCMVADILDAERVQATHRLARAVQERGFIPTVEEEVYSEAIRAYDDMIAEHRILGEAR